MKIVGLDLGKTHVRLVEFESGFGKFEVRDYRELRIPEGKTGFEVASEMIVNLEGRPDKVGIAFPTTKMTFRNLSYQVKDKRDAMGAVRFALEDDLPFDIDGVVYDQAFTNTTKGDFKVHVEATLKNHLLEMLENLEQNGINPDLVTTETWAYRVLMNEVVGAEHRGPVILANIGKSRTTFYTHHDGNPLAIREFDWGGDDITRAISQKYGITMEDAEKAKIDNGFILNPGQREKATQEQIEFSETIQLALKKLYKEAKQTALTCKNLCKEAPAKIFLTGETSLLPGIQVDFESEVRAPTEKLKPLGHASMLGVDYSEKTEAAYALATGIGLCLAKPDKVKPINLLKGEFAKSGGGGEFTSDTLKAPLIGIAAILVCFLISVIAQKTYYDSQIESVDKRYDQTVKAFFGGFVSSGALRNYKTSPSRLKKKVQSELDKQKSLSQLFGDNPRSPVGFLKSLSDTVTRGTVVDLVNFTVGSAPDRPYDGSSKYNVVLSFLVASPQVSGRLEQALGRIMNNVQKKEEKAKSLDGKSEAWKVTFTGEPKENAYGK